MEALQRILQGANVAQVNLGDGHQTFNMGKDGRWQPELAPDAGVVDIEVVSEGGASCENAGEGVAEELCHFIYPGLDDREALVVNRQIRDLVKRFPMKDICSFLNRLAEEKRILLPQIPQNAFDELHRMGMPSPETKGFGYDNFCKYYRK